MGVVARHVGQRGAPPRPVSGHAGGLSVKISVLARIAIAWPLDSLEGFRWFPI